MKTIPGISYGPAPRTASRASALAQPPKLVVVHCTANTASAAAEARYAATRADPSGNWTSCHVYVDESGALGSLSLDLQAWAAYGWANARAWHVELCGLVNRVPEATQRIGAAVVRQLCQLGSIPMVHLDGPAVRALHDGRRSTGGVTGHLDITDADFDNNDHSDPGESFDWARFMSWVNAGTAGGGDDMGWDEKIGAGYSPGGDAYGQHSFRTAVGYTWYRVDEIKAAVLAGNAGDEARDKTTLAAITALTDMLRASGGDIDAAPILAAIQAAQAETVSAVQELAAENADLRRRLAAALAGPDAGAGRA